MKLPLTTIFLGIVVFVWILLFVSLLQDDRGSTASKPVVKLRNNVAKIQEEPFWVKPITQAEVARNMTVYLQTLHNSLSAIAGKKVTADQIWDTFLDVTKNTFMKWDEENKERFAKPRNDESIFVGLGTYRDPFCPMTLKSLYANAGNPEKLFVGLFQQNCFGPKCRTGVLVGGKVEDAGPDVDCYVDFCASKEGIDSNACNNGHVRLFNVNESESLGPYMARYLGTKFYGGEQYYLQIDSHSEFVQNWDKKLIKMVVDAPAAKPVISTYPPGQDHKWRDSIGWRLCNAGFATSDIEHKIVRLGTSKTMDKKQPDIPKYAPFAAAGFFFAPAGFLSEVPFDPFLPWIFMGEEISISVRLWTSGYDIFSPTINVLNHYYVRRHYPKFWESVNRFFKRPVHNQIVDIVLERVKSMLGYPESAAPLVKVQSALYNLENWGMGNKRLAKDYFKMVGLNFETKSVNVNKWCVDGEWPEEAKSNYRPELSGVAPQYT